MTLVDVCMLFVVLPLLFLLYVTVFSWLLRVLIPMEVVLGLYCVIFAWVESLLLGAILDAGK